MTQNDGCANDLDTVIRLEELDDGLAELAEKVGKVQSCDMGDSNSAANKPGGLPSESQTMAILKYAGASTTIGDLCRGHGMSSALL